MKIFNKLLIIIVILLSLTSCDLFESIFGTKTTLKIINNTSFELDYINWYDNNEEKYSFGNDDVWDYVDLVYAKGLKSGSSAELEVAPGNSPVYFYFTSSAKRFYTVEYVQVNEGDEITFTLSDSTSVYEVSGN